MGAKQDRAFLDHLEAYLAKRDGVDKALKVLRYSSKVWLASPSLVQASDPAFAKKVKDFEASVGISRKAFRLGKFVQDVNALRRISDVNSRDGFLELVATIGEGFYYFMEQFVWLALFGLVWASPRKHWLCSPFSPKHFWTQCALQKVIEIRSGGNAVDVKCTGKVKAGAIDKRHSKRLQKWSAWAEFSGYLGSVTLKALQVSALRGKEIVLLKALRDSDSQHDRERISSNLDSVRSKRFMKTLSLVQDLADSLLALNDIKDGQGTFAKPRLLALAGLVSALISTHKNWKNC